MFLSYSSSCINNLWMSSGVPLIFPLIYCNITVHCHLPEYSIYKCQHHWWYSFWVWDWGCWGGRDAVSGGGVERWPGLLNISVTFISLIDRAAVLGFLLLIWHKKYKFSTYIYRLMIVTSFAKCALQHMCLWYKLLVAELNASIQQLLYQQIQYPLVSNRTCWPPKTNRKTIGYCSVGPSCYWLGCIYWLRDFYPPTYIWLLSFPSLFVMLT